MRTPCDFMAETRLSSELLQTFRLESKRMTTICCLSSIFSTVTVWACPLLFDMYTRLVPFSHQSGKTIGMALREEEEGLTPCRSTRLMACICVASGSWVQKHGPLHLEPHLLHA
mmetsp:Transcript_4988/g.5586  ORF Transcript_4988/g.5586 Transcript_4988/m.5586 type:complete len:114 (-) Transcript_4988:17-358(-)